LDVEEEILHVEKEKKKVAVGPRTWKASSEAVKSVMRAVQIGTNPSLTSSLAVACRIGFTGGGPRANG
jgi:hypothetical protein